MASSTRWMAWGLCGLISLTAVACRQRNELNAVGVDPLQSETETAVTVSPTAVEPGRAPGAEPTPTPGTPSATPATPGSTGTALSSPQAALLIASQPEARINLRSQPTTTSTAKGYGLVGDPVQLLRSAPGSDGTWYYVKFEQSGAEGWIRGDFINTAGRATPLSPRASQSNTCTGQMEGMTVTAYYDANGFHLVRFVNMETRNTFDATLSRQGSSNQGQPLYQGSASPPTGGSYPVVLTDLSGGNPRGGSQIDLNYTGIEGRVTCN
jgi:hypothetical protein